MIKRISFIAFFIIFTSLQAEEKLLVRYPAINKDGSKIAFSYQGDIWTVDSKGGNGLRLTVNEGDDRMPRFSFDGKNLAFQSNRYGNNDIFVMPSTGGLPKRLTYNSANDGMSGYGKDGEIIFTTARSFREIEWTPEIYGVNENGETPRRLTDALGSNPEKSPNGRFIAYVDGICPVDRFEYRGSANKQIYLFDTKNNKYLQLTKFDGNDFLPKWGDDKTIYYLSALKGVYNIFKLSIDENGIVVGEPVQITDFDDDGIRHFDISSNGEVIVFEKDTNIYTMASKGGKSTKVEIKISSDYRTNPEEYRTLNSGISDYSVSPNGKFTAFVVRGEIFVSENSKDKRKTVNVSNSPYRDRSVAWLSDSTIVFVSDRDGQNDLYLVKSSDSKKPDFLKTLKLKTIRLTDTKIGESSPVISPDKNQIAYVRGKGELVVSDISKDGKLSNEKILVDTWNAPSDIAWSPDSKYLAYSLTNLEFNDEVYIQLADNSAKAFNLTMHPRQDSNPIWSKDGSKLGFISYRNNGNGDIWFVWLQKKDWEKTKQDWEESDEEVTKKSPKDTKKGKDSLKTTPVVIDFEDIRERFVQVTALPGNESDIAISEDGKTFYYVTNRNSNQTYKADQDLFSIKWDGTGEKQLTTNSAKPYGVSLDPTGKYLYLLKTRGTLSRMDVGAGKEEMLPFSAEMKIDFVKEREQMFDETWRVINETFYDPQFHGNNWSKLKDKYRPLAIIASTDDDFRDIINMMMGELNASHMGIYASSGMGGSRESTGLLGIEIEPLDKGVKVKYVIPKSPASKTESKLNANDIIVSVNETPVTDEENFYSLFTNTVGKQVLLEVKNEKGELREVVIRPVSSLRDLLYEKWVNDRKELTEKYSNGKLGYIHIQSMDWESFEKFESALIESGEGKDGVLIDVRYNGGGWTTDYLLTILNVRQHAYTIPRGATDNLEKDKLKFQNYYAYSERLPFPAWTKPSITLCNSSSYSNAEIFSHAYKTLELGDLVGIPTFGAVISTGGYTLIDGSSVRTPGRAWFVKGTNVNMENNAAVPDFVVENPQDYRTTGEDLQLKKAVDELLKKLK